MIPYKEHTVDTWHRIRDFGFTHPTSGNYWSLTYTLQDSGVVAVEATHVPEEGEPLPAVQFFFVPALAPSGFLTNRTHLAQRAAYHAHDHAAPAEEAVTLAELLP
jgi:hypothetical protein